MNKNIKTICMAIIFVTTSLVFFSSLNCGFLNWDDNIFLTQNSSVQKLDWSHLKGLFTTTEGACYAPLSRLSMATDYFLWKKNPFGYHFTNLVLHAGSACMVFLIGIFFFKKTSIKGNHLYFVSLISALLFSLHPLRVESVVWISERRDVLSVFFGLLSVYLYLKYTYKKNTLLYGASIFIYIMALLSKASVATLPLVLLLVDYYPLKRLDLTDKQKWKDLILEKVPFFILGFVCGALGTYFQIVVGTAPSLFENMVEFKSTLSIVSNGRYLLKIMGFIFPLNPLELVHHAYLWSDVNVWASFLFLSAITLFCLKTYKEYPAFTVSWFSYLILILPFTGIVGAGGLLTADRYTYLASIPIVFFVTAFGYFLFRRDNFHYGTWMGLILSVGIISILALRTIEQIKIWNSSETFWKHALKIDDQNIYALQGLADIECEKGNYEKAIAYCKRSIEISPLHAGAWLNLGYAFQKLESYPNAISAFERVLKITPSSSKAHYNLGWVYAKSKDFPNALFHYEFAQKLDPSAQTLYNIAFCYESQDNLDKAVVNYEQAALLGFHDAWTDWSTVKAKQGFPREAYSLLRSLLKTNTSPRLRLACAESVFKMPDASIEERQFALEILHQLDEETQGKSEKVKLLLKNFETHSPQK
jgi:tetratricopeptide (TPR) repeat protein